MAYNHITERLKGKIRVTSTLGEGTCVEIRLKKPEHLGEIISTMLGLTQKAKKCNKFRLCWPHGNSWIFKLLPQKITQQAMLDTIKCLSRFLGNSRQADPNKNGASDMITLNPCLSALTAFNSCELFRFTMKLLNLPTQGTRLLRAQR